MRDLETLKDNTNENPEYRQLQRECIDNTKTYGLRVKPFGKRLGKGIVAMHPLPLTPNRTKGVSEGVKLSFYTGDIHAFTDVAEADKFFHPFAMGLRKVTLPSGQEVHLIVASDVNPITCSSVARHRRFPKAFMAEYYNHSCKSMDQNVMFRWKHARDALPIIFAENCRRTGSNTQLRCDYGRKMVNSVDAFANLSDDLQLKDCLCSNGCRNVIKKTKTHKGPAAGCGLVIVGENGAVVGQAMPAPVQLPAPVVPAPVVPAALAVPNSVASAVYSAASRFVSFAVSCLNSVNLGGAAAPGSNDV